MQDELKVNDQQQIDKIRSINIKADFFKNSMGFDKNYNPYLKDITRIKKYDIIITYFTKLNNILQ